MAKVLVTGGCGFIGAHLVRKLLEQGDHVVVLDNMHRVLPETRAALESQARVQVIEADIRRFEQLEPAMIGVDYVYHLAAQSNVMGALHDPDYSVTTNVNGTFNVLRAAANAQVKRLIFTSSREVYGDPRTLPVSEVESFNAKNAYGASKVAGEAYCGSFASTLNLDVQIVRLANVYGPGDSGRVIPLWVEAALEGHDLSVYGGEQVIDFLWVGTAVEALLFACKNGLPGPVNIGSGQGTKILDLAQRVLDVTGSKSRVVLTAARGIEVARFVADVGLMRSLGLIPDEDPLQHLAEVVSSHSRV